MLRVLASAALAVDLGEPANLEHVTVRVDLTTATAEVGYRDRWATIEVPVVIPPWLNPSYVDGNRAAVPLAVAEEFTDWI